MDKDGLPVALIIVSLFGPLKVLVYSDTLTPARFKLSLSTQCFSLWPRVLILTSVFGKLRAKMFRNTSRKLSASALTGHLTVKFWRLVFSTELFSLETRTEMI